jgi:Menin
VHSQVAEDHCWISLDGTAEREFAAEVAAENPAQQGEPPTDSSWASWLYNAGHVAVCSPSQVVTAIVTSMDTCVGDKSTQDWAPARRLQRQLLERLQDTDSTAMYPNASCVLAELQQDVVLDRARQAGKAGGDVASALQKLGAPYQAMMQCAGLTVGAL